MNHLNGKTEFAVRFGIVTGSGGRGQRGRGARGGQHSCPACEQEHLQSVRGRLSADAYISRFFTFVSAGVITEHGKQTEINLPPVKGQVKIPFGAELVLDPSEVLPNLLIATGFSGAITITLSHSTVHWLLIGMSVSCVMTELKRASILCFIFITLITKG